MSASNSIASLSGPTAAMGPQDNQAFRSLFTLPPVQTSASTALTVPEMPEPKVVTGDRELDAVLWLRDCIKTAHPALIDKAMGAFRQIKTPAKELEDRYCAWLRASSGGNPFAVVFGGLGFARLDDLAKDSIKRKARRGEAMARFGSAEEIFKLTPAEVLCKRSLSGLKESKTWRKYDADAAARRFATVPDLVPHTLADCLHQQEYCDSLYWLRNEIDRDSSDPVLELGAHDDYCFAMLAKITPRTKDEALAVLAHIEQNDAKDREETPAILRNLITGGWA